MNAWERYVTKNPMKAETRRSFRRFFGLGKLSEQAIRLGSILFAILYVVLLAMFFSYMSDSDSSLWAFLETAILLLVGSIGFYTAISGERERRTWDVLRSLPVTRTQIVVGKFIGALTVVTVVWLALLPFNLVSAFSTPSYDFGRLPLSRWARVEANLLAAMVSYFSALLAVALTLLLSSRARTSITALSASLATLFLWLVVWPNLLGIFMAGFHSEDGSWELTMNPFTIQNLIFAPETSSFGANVSGLAVTLTYLLFCVALIGILITWTDKTLSFAEDQVDFIRRKNHA